MRSRRGAEQFVIAVRELTTFRPTIYSSELANSSYWRLCLGFVLEGALIA
jgi:hypothetical protein